MAEWPLIITVIPHLQSALYRHSYCWQVMMIFSVDNNGEHMELLVVYSLWIHYQIKVKTDEQWFSSRTSWANFKETHDSFLLVHLLMGVTVQRHSQWTQPNIQSWSVIEQVTCTVPVVGGSAWQSVCEQLSSLTWGFHRRRVCQELSTELW